MFDRLFTRRNSGLEVSHPEDMQYAVHASLDELIGLRLLARQLNYSSRVISANLMTGNHVSHFKGRGMDYLESRSYQPGDDIRNMDWRVTARTGQPHIKLFQEERERPVLFMLDLNPGMFFASHGRFKSVIAAQTTALLAWMAVKHGDRVGGLILNRSHVEISPRGNKKGILSFLHQVAEHSDPAQLLNLAGDKSMEAQPSPPLHDGLMRLARMARPGSLIYILSDFYRLDEPAIRQLRQLRAKSECVLVRILDGLETTPPPANRYVVTNGRQQSIVNTASTQQVALYRHWFKQHQQQVEQVASHLAIPLVELSTTGHPVEKLKQFFSSPPASLKSRKRQ